MTRSLLRFASLAVGMALLLAAMRVLKGVMLGFALYLYSPVGALIGAATGACASRRAAARM